MLDIDIVMRAQKGDTDAFRVIFITYKQKTFRTAFLMLRDCQLSEDIVQETFLQVYIRLQRLVNPYALEKWIYKIAVNMCLDKIKKQGKKAETSIDDVSETELFLVSDSKPEEEAVQKEIQGRVVKGIYSLPVKHRTVMILYYFNEMSIEEIAEALGCSEGTVKSRLFYGRKTLKDIFSGEGLDNFTENTGGALYGN